MGTPTSVGCTQSPSPSAATVRCSDCSYFEKAFFAPVMTTAQPPRISSTVCAAGRVANWVGNPAAQASGHRPLTRCVGARPSQPYHGLATRAASYPGELARGLPCGSAALAGARWRHRRRWAGGEPACSAFQSAGDDGFSQKFTFVSVKRARAGRGK